MAATTQPVNVDMLFSELSRKTKRLSTYVSVLFVLVVLSSGCLGLLFWKKAKAVDAAQRELSFSLWVTDYNNGSDFVVPQVNMIQFLRRGYSVSFDSVKYTQEGLALTGTIGNATQLWVNSLAVKFVARPFPYQIREKWEKQAFPWWDGSWDIGSGETSVGSLNPGSSVPFSVTIPNVKQTSDSIEIAVSFSGERYLYMK
jgi:hypothetical protein